MGTISDRRGSDDQRNIFTILRGLYPGYTVLYEAHVPSTNQRFDMLVLELGIAIEYNGEQHYKFIEHFHVNQEGYISSIKADNKKALFAKENGIKLVTFKGKETWTSSMIAQAIEEKSYPDTDYDQDIFKAENARLGKQRTYRRESYRYWKALSS